MSLPNTNTTPLSATIDGKTLAFARPLELPRLTPRKKPACPPSPHSLPRAPPLPPLPSLDTIVFQTPRRRISTFRDLALFQRSPTYILILSFVYSLADAARDKKISFLSLDTTSPIIHKLCAILSSIEDIIASCPPADQGSSRFGNYTFRLFLDEVDARSDSWHSSLGLPGPPAIAEVSTYFREAFGNRIRIDYGSGHELNFMIWLLCLNRLSLLPESEFSAVILIVFPRYIQLMRMLQSTYYLEPAGSHGVWGLDDYHFLPFLFGASQLLHHPYIRPLGIHNKVMLEEEGDDYLYLDMIRWTTRTKSVTGLKWTQPMLDDISGAKSWEKVENGMRRMFEKELLGKLPVMQHFLFGDLLSATEGMSRPGVAGLAPRQDENVGGELAPHADHIVHVHRDDPWGDCCGIKIPSTVAATQEARRNGKAVEFRAIPFD